MNFRNMSSHLQEANSKQSWIFHCDKQLSLYLGLLAEEVMQIWNSDVNIG